MKPNTRIDTPLTGLAIVTMVGPSLVWVAEYIGSGEVILATRAGAILGYSVIWPIFIGIFLKFWIGLSGARYTVCTGEGMIDMFARIPGPRNWAVWVTLGAQFIAAAVAIGSIAAAAGAFLSELIPGVSQTAGGWLVSLFGLAVVWSGTFERLKVVMSIFVVVIVLGVGYVAIHVFPGAATFLTGLIPNVPKVPQWAIDGGVSSNPWREVLPLLGWGAGGFASQVWYTYWVLGAGYGAAKGRQYGQPADTEFLKRLTPDDGRKLKGWCRVVAFDATLAMIIGVTVTTAFLIAGAGVLGARHLAPSGTDVAFTLSTVFSSQWGVVGGKLFILGGAAALVSTQVAQLAGWPRLLADTFRLCFPAFNKKLAWKSQFRLSWFSSYFRT
jgi:Mn2+/Fe2+ NRAMP family transporter